MPHPQITRTTKKMEQWRMQKIATQSLAAGISPFHLSVIPNPGPEAKKEAGAVKARSKKRKAGEDEKQNEEATKKIKVEEDVDQMVKDDYAGPRPEKVTLRGFKYWENRRPMAGTEEEVEDQARLRGAGLDGEDLDRYVRLSVQIARDRAAVISGYNLIAKLEHEEAELSLELEELNKEKKKRQ